MAKIFGELETAQLEQLSADPTGTGNVKGRVYYNTTTDKVKYYDGVGWREMGEGGTGGGINYIANSNAETNTDGWSIADYGATSVPNTAAPPNTHSQLSFTRDTTDEIRDTASFKINKSGVGSAQGEAIYYDFTIDSADLTMPLRVSFDFVDTSTLDDGDFRIYLQHSSDSFASDYTNIELTPRDLTAGTKRYEAYGQTHHTNQDMRLVIICTKTDSDTPYILIDNVQVGPGSAAIISPDVGFSAYKTTAQAITAGTEATIIYNGISHINGISYDDTTGIATVEEAGRYHITAQGSVDNAITSGFNTVLHIDKNNGTNIASDRNRSAQGDERQSVSIDADLIKGDTIRVRWFTETGGGNGNIDVSASFGQQYLTFSMHKISGSGESGSAARIVGSRAKGCDTTETLNNTKYYMGFAAIDYDKTSSWVNIGSAISTTYTSTTYYEVPESGLYDINSHLSVSDGTLGPEEDIDINIEKNGVIVSAANTRVSSSQACVYITDTLEFIKGDKISISVLQISGGGVNFLADQTASHFSISKRQGNSTPVCGERIFGHASDGSGQSLQVTDVSWDNIESDSHNMFDGTTLTMPRAGDLLLTTIMRYNTQSMTTGHVLNTFIYKNGSAYLRAGRQFVEVGGTVGPSVPVSYKITGLIKGDTIKLQTSNPASYALSTNDLDNRISWEVF